MRLPKESAALLSTFADYFGLAVISPTLPFYLEEIGVERIALWTGVIVSIQFAAVVIANNFWGRVSDRYGAHRAIMWTMAGDALFFGLSAVAFVPWSLVLIRFCAGLFSPLVPALSYLFAVLTPAETTAGIGRYAMALLCAYVLGAAVVGATYDEIGWLGMSLMTAAVAAGILLFVMLTPVPEGVKVDGKAKETSGVYEALRSSDFIAHGATAFAMGFAMNMILGVQPRAAQRAPQLRMRAIGASCPLHASRAARSCQLLTVRPPARASPGAPQLCS
jgi:MFS family permease